MSKGINLLGPEKQVSVKIGSQRIKLLRSISLSVLFGVSGLSIVLFFLIALSPLPSLQKQEETALKTLSQYHPDVAKYLLIEERLKNSENILLKRLQFAETFSKIKAQLPENAEITGVTMNEDEISITVASASLTVLDTFLNSLIDSTQRKENYSKIVLTRFSTNEGSNMYSLTIRVVTL